MWQCLETLKKISASPRAQLDKYLKEGKKVVTVAPVYTPEEIVHAFGFVPMGVWGADIEINESKKYYPAFICSIMQTILELGIKGTYKGASAIIIPSLCDSLKTLGQNWKFAVKDIPFIPMTYPQNRKPSYAIDFTIDMYKRVIRDLEKATDEKFDESKLAGSFKIYNEHNRVMREFEEAASLYELSTKDRNAVFKSAWFMEKEEHTKLVKELINCLKEEGKATKKLRIYTSGILSDAPNLLEIFDDNNMRKPIKDRINLWIEDMIDATTIDFSSIQNKRNIELLDKDWKVIIIFTAQIISFFLNEANISIKKDKAISISKFIISEVKSAMKSLKIEEI